MTREAATPPGFWERVEQMIDKAVARYARSGAMRNSSMTGGDLTLRGGSVRVRNAADTVTSAYWGPVTPALPDGTYQPGWIMRREDGSLAAALYDPSPTPGDYHQFLALYDRSQQIIVSDDTASGSGLARPYIPGAFYPARYADWLGTSSTVFETVWDARMPKQHPNLYVRVRASNDTAGETGEVQVLVNGVPLGAPQATAFVQAHLVFGPLPVAGTHMGTLVVEVQARVTLGVGQVRTAPARLEGWQS